MEYDIGMKSWTMYGYVNVVNKCCDVFDGQIKIGLSLYRIHTHTHTQIIDTISSISFNLDRKKRWKIKTKSNLKYNRNFIIHIKIIKVFIFVKLQFLFATEINSQKKKYMQISILEEIILWANNSRGNNSRTKLTMQMHKISLWIDSEFSSKFQRII